MYVDFAFLEREITGFAMKKIGFFAERNGQQLDSNNIWDPDSGLHRHAMHVRSPWFGHGDSVLLSRRPLGPHWSYNTRNHS